MIVEYHELHRYRGRVAMVDGGFDPIHKGHIDYFKAAFDKLQVPLLCNVASDEYVRRKHPPLLPVEQRVAIIDAIRYVEYTHINRSSTEDVLRELRPRYYVKGSDWRGRLPPEQELIAVELNISIVYLDTVIDSSTRVLDRFLRETAALREPV